MHKNSTFAALVNANAAVRSNTQPAEPFELELYLKPRI